MFRCNLPDSISLTMACVAPYVDVRIYRSNYRRAYLDSIQPIENPIPWQLPRKAQYLLQRQVNRLMPHSAITPQLHFFGNLASVRVWLTTWTLISTYKLDHIITDHNLWCWFGRIPLNGLPYYRLLLRNGAELHLYYHESWHRYRSENVLQVHITVW